MEKKSVINFVIGLGMCVVTTLVNGATGSLVGFAKEILSSSSEFLGDGLQGFIAECRERRKNKKDFGEIKEQFNADDEEKFKKIINDLKLKPDEEKESSKNKKSNKLKEKNLDKDFFNFVIDTINDTNCDFKEYLEQSETYKEYEKENFQKADALAKAIELARDTFLQIKFKELGGDYQVLAAAIIKSLSDRFDVEEKKFINYVEERLIPRLEMQDGNVSLQKIAYSKRTIKYILSECPECGYKGPWIYTNEKTNKTSCAACGSTYEILKGVDPELFDLIENKSGDIIKTQSDLVKSNQEIAQDQKKQIEIINELKEQLKDNVTRQYLDACIRDQSDEFESNINNLKEYLENSENKTNSIITSFINETNKIDPKLDDIIERLKQKTNEDKRYNEYLSSQLNSMNDYIMSCCEQAMLKFDDLGNKSGEILGYVKNLVTKEYLENVTNALGSDLKRAVTESIHSGYESVAALNATSLAQIMAKIDELRIDVDREKRNLQINDLTQPSKEQYKKLEKKFDEMLSNQNKIICGQIASFQELLEKSQDDHAEMKLSLRRIIESQDEMKTILLAKVGVSVNHNDIEKMYSGKIPSKYLYNDGLGGAFPCPYCSAEEERKLNDDQYCQCSVCGNKFVAVNPFAPSDIINEKGEREPYIDIMQKKMGWTENDIKLPTKANVEKWIDVHTLEVVGNEIKFKNESIITVAFLPDEITELRCKSKKKDEIYYKFNIDVCSSINVLIMPKVTDIDDGYFNNFTFDFLKAIIFPPDEKNKRYYTKDCVKMYGASGVHIYGRNCEGEIIKLEKR